MSSSERFSASRESNNESINSDSRLERLSVDDKKTAERILMDMSVVREAYIDNMEGDFDGLDLTLKGNREAVSSLLDSVLVGMRKMNKAEDYVKSYEETYENFQSNLDGYRLENKNQVFLTKLKQLEKIANQFISKAARESVMPKVEKAPIEKKEVEKPKQFVDVGKVIDSLGGKFEGLKINADTLNRVQELRYVFSSSNYENVDRYNGDQIFVQVMLKDLNAGLSTRNDIDGRLDGLTYEDITKLSDRDVAKIVYLYQKSHGLKVDGKFGYQTFTHLKDSASKYGYRIVDRSGSIGDSYKDDVAYSQILSGKRYSKKKPKRFAKRPKNSVERNDNWNSIDADLSRKMNDYLDRDLLDMNDEEFKDAKKTIQERFVHHDRDVNEFLDLFVDKTEELVSKIVSILSYGGVNFQDQALIDAFSNFKEKSVYTTIEESAKKKIDEFKESAGETLDEYKELSRVANILKEDLRKTMVNRSVAPEDAVAIKAYMESLYNRVDGNGELFAIMFESDELREQAIKVLQANDKYDFMSKEMISSLRNYIAVPIENIKNSE